VFKITGTLYRQSSREIVNLNLITVPSSIQAYSNLTYFQPGWGLSIGSKRTGKSPKLRLGTSQVAGEYARGVALPCIFELTKRGSYQVEFIIGVRLDLFVYRPD